jgi:hypothetical protein
LNGVYAAEYHRGDGRVTLFIHRAADDVAARALLADYRAYLEEHGRLLPDDTHASNGIVTGEVAGRIDAVFAKGRFLGGVIGAGDAVVAQAARRMLYDRLTVP